MTPQPRADVCRKLGLPLGEYGFGLPGGVPSVTLDEYKEAIRLKIAEYDGYESAFVDSAGVVRGHKNGSVWIVPDYPNDLNACHEWESKLSNEQKRDHGSILMEMCHSECRKFGAIYATALQRCEARILIEVK